MTAIELPRERPILFQGAMVRALLAGTKTQTRRVFKQATGPSLSVGMDDDAPGVAELSWLWGDGPGHDVHETIARIPCPYGRPGDRLWVRETFYAWGRWETRYSERKKRDEWHFVDMTLECGRTYAYDADEDTPLVGKRNSRVTPLWWRRPAIFMPRAASRILLELTEVRVERLQEISEADCWAEGIEEVMHDFPDASQIDMAYRLGLCVEDAKPLYAQLWESINGAKSWDANPWVWAVSFKVIKP